MHMGVEVCYCGQAVAVTEEVALFLAESDRQLENADRRYGDHNNCIRPYPDPDTVLDTKHCTGRNYLLNKAMWNMERKRVRSYIHSLGPELERLYYMRYVLDFTEQKIADKLGISKMAVSKRLKKLQGLIEKRFLLSAQPERERSRSGFFCFLQKKSPFGLQTPFPTVI